MWTWFDSEMAHGARCTGLSVVSSPKRLVVLPHLSHVVLQTGGGAYSHCWMPKSDCQRVCVQVSAGHTSTPCGQTVWLTYRDVASLGAAASVPGSRLGMVPVLQSRVRSRCPSCILMHHTLSHGWMAPWRRVSTWPCMDCQALALPPSLWGGAPISFLRTLLESEGQ